MKLHIEHPDFFGQQRVIKAYEELQNYFNAQTNSLDIVPYVLTGSREQFIGKKANITLGILGSIIDKV